MDSITIIYEDDRVLVLDKPSGLVVTPGAGNPEEKTLVAWLLARYGESLRQVGSGGHRPGIVHRLDRGTSGVMVVAKTQASFEYLVQQFKRRHVQKKYLALVWGDLRQDRRLNGQLGFTIDAPIGRNPRNRMRFAVVESGKEAVTVFRINKHIEIAGQVLTVVECFPKTGRTHQIRVHLKSFGYSIVGDDLYQSRKEKGLFSRMVLAGKLQERLYLHALRITLSIRSGQIPQAFESQQTPDILM